MADDSLVFNAENNLAPTSAPTATPAPSGPQGDAAVWTVLGEAGNNPQGQLGVASTIYNRQKVGGYGSPSAVVTDPANGYEAWQDAGARANVQKQYPVGSPAYNAAQTTIQGINSGQIKPLPYDSFYSPTAQAAKGRQPPAWADNTGTNIGGNVFYSGKYAPPNMTPDQQAAWNAVSGGATGPAAITAGPQHLPVTPQQGATVAARNSAGLIDTTKPQGDDANPYTEKLRSDGTAEPLPAGAYVGLDGQFHPGPRSTVQMVQNAFGGFGQGIGSDQLASAARLGLGGGDPFYGALSQVQGGPSQHDIYQGANQSFAAEQGRYGMRHAGEPEAQFWRLAGQAILATLAAAATPELAAPDALAGVLGPRVAGGLATGATNAFRGAAAAATNVGANPNQSVASQLGTGALAGVALPAVLGAAGKVGGAITGAGRSVDPAVAQLADLAQTKYGINLASGQVMGANGDRGAATAYSQMLGSDAKVSAGNVAQRQQWMKGVTSTYGDPSGNVSPTALTAAKAQVVAPMNDIAARTVISPAAADDVQTRIGQTISDAQDVLGDGAKPLLNMAEKIGSARAANGISGQTYKALTTQGAPLDRLMQSADPNVAHYAGQIREALDDGLEASASPEDVDAFQNARWQYKNLMTVARAAQNQNNIGPDGVFTPAALNTATTGNFKGRAFQGAGDLDELNAIRKAFMTEPPNSGTASRLANILAPLGWAGGVGGLTDIGSRFIQDPTHGIGALGAGIAAGATDLGYNALRSNAIGGPAKNIIGRSLPNAPRSALSGLGGLAKSVEVPLSALSALRGVPMAPANATPVGANAQ